MRTKRYDFLELSAGVFQFWFQGSLAFSFSRECFRNKFESFASNRGFSSNWVGSMLKQWHKRYPLLPSPPRQTALDRYSDEYWVDYLRSKGCRCVKPKPVSDVDVVKRLEASGWEIDGMIAGGFYSTSMLSSKSVRCLVTPDEGNTSVTG